MWDESAYKQTAFGAPQTVHVCVYLDKGVTKDDATALMQASIDEDSRKAAVIARDMAGMSELVPKSGGGILYRSYEELLAALSRIAGSPSLREQLGENGYRAFQLRWSRRAHLEMCFGLRREVALRKFGFVPWEAECDGESAA